jgi:hypothetical protein
MNCTVTSPSGRTAIAVTEHIALLRFAGACTGRLPLTRGDVGADAPLDSLLGNLCHNGASFRLYGLYRSGASIAQGIRGASNTRVAGSLAKNLLGDGEGIQGFGETAIGVPSAAGFRPPDPESTRCSAPLWQPLQHTEHCQGAGHALLYGQPGSTPYRSKDRLGGQL